MSLDPTIREQTYQYFCQEAPELLQSIEQGLLHLRENWGINQVNNLMRATHTLKGAATSVGLDTIARIAHSLEDIFKALCQPDLTLDPEVEALLCEGLECLRLPLMAELNGSTINEAEVLNRTAEIFALLQVKLGDCFIREPYLPTSADLGFDLTQSMFELGVTQRLEQMTAVLGEGDADSVAIAFQTHAEVLLGLAESLNLTGFAAIARATIAALTYHPEAAIAIAQTALADLQAGQAAVLAGDRTQGGKPSDQLQQFAAPPDFAALTSNELAEEPADSLLESIWGTMAAIEPAQEPADVSLLEVQSLSPAADAPFPEQPIRLQKESVQNSGTVSPSIRVAVKHLEQFSTAIGDLVTHQNRQSLQIEQLQTIGQTLLKQVRRHQKLLTRLQEQTSREARRMQRPLAENQAASATPLFAASRHKSSRRSRKKRAKGFGGLENQNSSAEMIRSLLDQTVQLTETAEAIQLLTEQANQLLEKQHQLLSGTQNALVEARMLPISEIFGRFPKTLQQLETLHNKPIALKLQGSEVLVDKTVAEKLFDPLLHLVRNAFDHGIEPIAVRQQRGKAEKGLILLSAYHQGRHLVIEVQDDGNGLDFDHIRRRAIEQQHLTIAQADRLNQQQLAELLFEPGFSTAAQVSDLSGRGVGLDVVRNQITALQGSVTVRSELHQGTTFVLRIPLNLAIAQLFVCEADGKTYALLHDPIEQIVMPRSSQIQERNGGRFLRWQQEQVEELVPIYSLAEASDYEAPTPAISVSSSLLTRSIAHLSPAHFISNAAADDLSKPVILIHCRTQLLGLEVDRLMSEQKLVIRPLGSMIHPPHYVQGATTLADGQLALVIDAARLLGRILDDDRETQMSHYWATPTAAAVLPASEPFAAQPFLPAQVAPEVRAKPNTKILIIDDSITTRQSLILTLEKAGYQVIQAQDGHEGLDCFQQQPNIQLVICDIEMPHMNGFEFLRQRQQIPALAEVSVVMLSSRSDEKHRLLASQLGASVYMVKPFMEHKLLKMMKTLLEHSALNRVTKE